MPSSVGYPFDPPSNPDYVAEVAHPFDIEYGAYPSDIYDAHPPIVIWPRPNRFPTTVPRRQYHDDSTSVTIPARQPRLVPPNTMAGQNRETLNWGVGTNPWTTGFQSMPADDLPSELDATTAMDTRNGNVHTRPVDDVDGTQRGNWSYIHQLLAAFKSLFRFQNPK
jgi:hypothetical protein